MAEKRKLQAEIERCLKKIGEGVEEFDELLHKVQDAQNANLKDKYETDLKKEIKKLQRHRDQIKTWCASSDVKDKQTLIDKRKLIELKMEEFKAVERETKTKAFSKTGLSAEQKVDPKEREKEEIMTWLQDSLDQMRIQCDRFESELESLQAAGKRKKMDKDKQEKIDSLKSHLERHKYHSQRLELLLRLVINNTVEVDQIKCLRDDIDYYLEHSLTDDNYDFEAVEGIYDDLHLDLNELTQQLGIGVSLEEQEGNSETGTTASVSTTSPSPSPGPNIVSGPNSGSQSKESSCSKEVEEELSSAIRRNSISDDGDKLGAVRPSNTSRSTPATPLRLTNPSGGQERALSTPPPSAPSPLIQSYNAVVSHGQDALSNQGTASISPVSTPPRSRTPASGSLPPVPPSIPTSSTQWESTVTSSAFGSAPVPLLETLTSSSVAQAMVNGPADADDHATSQDSSILSLKQMAELALPSPGRIPSGVDNLGLGDLGAFSPGSLMSRLQTQNQQPSEPVKVLPNSGASPLGRVTLSQETQAQKAMLDTAALHLPHPADSEKLRLYMPRSPTVVPNYYPSAPPRNSDTMEFYSRLAPETLFFVFYYMEGSRAQYLAAQALKKQSWRFHTKYLMWFQRHEEPKAITDDYEQGTYIYFDFEKWAQRKKENFTFEYKFLEDRGADAGIIEFWRS